jgi:hypothetical protein
MNYNVIMMKSVQPEIKDTYLATERAKEKYRKSDLGKAAKNRYDHSDSGQAARKRYLESEKGKEALLRYYLSEKAESTRQRRQALIKLFRKLDKYLRKYPDKTIEDYFNSLKGDS